MSTPFFLSLILFVAIVADLWTDEPRFIGSLAYRQHPYILAALVIAGLLLWVWVLAAARKREARFDGPIQTVRGRNGVLQPILATVFIVCVVNVAYSHSLPRLANLFLSQRVNEVPFLLTSDIEPFRQGCERASATSDGYGEVELCLPEGTAAHTGAGTGKVLLASGPTSWFGLEPRRIAAESEALPTIDDAPSVMDSFGESLPRRIERPPSGKLSQP